MTRLPSVANLLRTTLIASSDARPPAHMATERLIDNVLFGTEAGKTMHNTVQLRTLGGSGARMTLPITRKLSRASDAEEITPSKHQARAVRGSWDSPSQE